jgi:hypothetical protein
LGSKYIQIFGRLCRLHAATFSWTGYKSAAILATLLSTLVLVQCRLPLRTAIQISADEGFEFAKATLCLKGYKLYTEVWNDQPRLHTFLITQILKHISPSIAGPRLAVEFLRVSLDHGRNPSSDKEIFVARLRTKSPQTPGACGPEKIDEPQPWSPLSPMASTGQPSLASLHCASSSGDSGCLYTNE